MRDRLIGRTSPSEGDYLGSSPSPAAKLSIVLTYEERSQVELVRGAYFH